MDNLIERYIFDLVRRLPEGERAEVEQELRANIYDMLPEEPTPEAVREVLCQLGPPIALAEQYRQRPRYLISPATYDDYIRALKLVAIIVGLVLLAVGLILGGFDAMSAGNLVEGIAETVSSGISLAVSGVFQALVWTTVAFVIADRVRAGEGAQKESGWTPENLPELPQKDSRAIPLSDSIVELVLTVVFSALAILFCLGVFPAIVTLRGSQMQAIPLFDPAFLNLLLPAIVVLALLGVADCVAKIALRRWTPQVCAAVFVNELGSIAIWLFLLTRPNIFGAEAMDYFAAQRWGDFDMMQFLAAGNPNPVLLVIGLIIVVSGLATCGAALYKTLAPPFPKP